MNSQHLPHDWYPKPLPPNVTVGDRSWIYSAFAFSHFRSEAEPAVQIGSDSGIYHSCFFELGPRGSVSIGNFCAIVGAKIACNCAVVIEDYAFIAHDVVIADTHFAVPPQRSAGSASLPPERPLIRIGRNAWIGARAVILVGADLGEGAIVGAGTIVDFPVPSFAIVAGDPARIVGRCRQPEDRTDEG